MKLTLCNEHAFDGRQIGIGGTSDANLCLLGTCLGQTAEDILLPVGMKVLLVVDEPS